MNYILQINGISKTYKTVKALKEVTLNIPKGSVYGILGPNGSGKTTLLSIILDVIHADHGSYSWFNGEQSENHRKRMGALLETPNFYHYLSGLDNLKIAARIKEKNDADLDAILKTVGLYDRRASAFSSYSLGMKQRLAIGSALIGNPEVLILDEPTNGLDPTGIAEVRELIQDLNEKGITIILASHLLSEVEKVCTDVAILKNGNVLNEGTVLETLGTDSTIQVSAENMDELKAFLETLPGVITTKQTADKLIIKHDGSLNPENLNKLLSKKGIYLNHLVEIKKTLESFFIELTKTV